ncbi:hypothetical protein M9Y10_035952 [Tritrichomonas musculus]|uniref:USP domain-containing protein n=1 Tax=Tritrichomonas musculus TaxID=1915356 RepID=A0ABR2GX92_9EUKA
MKIRAQFINPNFYCSFNSLTQCLYNILPFRNLLLESDLTDIKQQPFIFFDPEIGNVENRQKESEKIEQKINFSKSALQFSINYQQIFIQMVDPSKRLDLTNCIEYLVDTVGHKVFKNSPGDPFVEFLTVISLLSDSNRAFYLNLLKPYTNKYIQLFSFGTSNNFKDFNCSIYLAPPPTFSIFYFPIDSYFYNFKAKHNKPNAVVLHSLPDILVVHFDYIDPIKPKHIQSILDFTGYVLDHTKSAIFRINSFVMMLNHQHAISYVRMMDNNIDTEREKWLICNDLQQKLIGKDELNRDLEFYSQNKQAIVGFYERKSC